MPISSLVVHAAVRAFADALGCSGAAHGLAVGLWVPSPDGAAAGGAIGLGTALAIVVATRGRLVPALVEGSKALGDWRAFQVSVKARTALVIGVIAGVSAVAGLGLAGATGPVVASPRNVASGLGATGVALLVGATFRGLRSRPREGKDAGGAAAPAVELPALAAAALAGIAHGCGVWPGVSRVGVATAVLLAAGVKPARALELSLLATVPFWVADFARAASSLGAFGAGHAILAMVFAFLGAFGAVSALRALVARRALPALSLWMIPLACAIFAYGRARPPSLDLGPAAGDTSSSDPAAASNPP